MSEHFGTKNNYNCHFSTLDCTTPQHNYNDNSSHNYKYNCATVHNITLTALHYISLSCTNYVTLRHGMLPFLSPNHTTLHCTTSRQNYNYKYKYTTLHCTALIALHYSTPLYNYNCNYTTLQYSTPPFLHHNYCKCSYN